MSIANYSTPEPPPRRRRRGRPPKQPCRVLAPTLGYAQIDKHRAGGRVVEVCRRIVFGSTETITEILGDKQINTSYVERDNLTSRQSNGRLVRKTLSHSKKAYYLTTPLGPGRHRVQFCTSASGIAGDLSSANPWSQVAAAYSCDGSGADRSYMDLGRAIVIPHSAIGRLNL